MKRKISEFYGRLQAVVDQKAKKDLLNMMGDFNAKIGKDNIGKELVLWKEGLDETNVNGEQFTDFYHFNSLVIRGSVFLHKRTIRQRTRLITSLSPEPLEDPCKTSAPRRELM